MNQKRTLLAAMGSLFVISQANAYSYLNDFESPVGSEFSTTTTSSFNGSTVLGRFTNGAVQLTLTGLTVGEVATIKFDFFALDSWDGSANNDRLVFDVDGVVKLDSTFSNVWFNNQNYPDPTGGANYAYQTGSDDRDSSHGGTLPNGSYGNTVYKFGGGGGNAAFTAMATSSTMVFTWTASNLQDISDESWALDNVDISQPNAVPEPATTAVLGFGALAMLRRRKK